MKRFKFCLSLVAFGIIFCCFAGSRVSADSPDESAEEPISADYEQTLFDTGFVHQVDIRLSDEDWEDLLANPIDKTKYKADIVIDGETIKDVSFATKGNSSLLIVAADPDSSRYSYRVNFGKYVDGQTYHGLDKLSLNNNISDATLMKDYFCYEIFRQAGVPAPLTSYVWLTVNGEDRGLYLAVEDEGDSFLGRVKDGKGVIYKPESTDVALTPEILEDMMKNGLPAQKNAKGADFIYKDDDPESYPDIFENIETDAEEKDNLAVIAAMKCLAEGKDLDLCLDTDEIIRYFAAHNFVLSYDSYTGTMLHNLILVENDGLLSVLPWDYNLSFGAFIAVIGEEALENSTDILNQGIDSPLIGADEDSRPLWSWIVKNDGFRKEYHEALDELVTKFFESGRFERKLYDLSNMLLPYIEKDPTGFYSAEEYQKGCKVLSQFGMRRAESIRKQLNGDLSSKTSEQSEQDKVDSSDLHLIDMGAGVVGMEKADSADSIKIETVSTDTFSMDYFKFGDGKRNLVILPGLSIQSVMGFADSVADEYSMFSEDYTVYVFDQRKDLPAEYSVREMTRDTAEAIRALGLEQVDLLGVSLGGMIAQEIAVEQPELVGKLALASAAACMDEERYSTIEKWVKLAKAGDKKELYLAFGEAVYPGEMFEQSKDLLIEAAKTVTDKDLERFLVLAECIKDFDITKDLKKISCPVLVIGSLDDSVLGPEASVQIAENLTEQKGPVLYLYDGYGHAAYDAAPDYRDRLLQWFQG